MYNKDLYGILKKIAVNAVSASKPCDWCYGYVKEEAPLCVALSERLEIDEDFIELGSRKAESLKKGDKLIMLRKSGGQLFFILDVIRDRE